MRPDDALIYISARIQDDLRRAAAECNPYELFSIMYALSRDVDEVITERLEDAYGEFFATDVYLDGTPVRVTAKSGTLNRAVNRIRKPGDPQGLSDAEKAWLEGKDIEGK